MGLVYAEITLINTEDIIIARRGLIKEQEIREVTVQALVDTGAWTLVINEATREKLGLTILGTETGKLADGTQEVYNLAGPLEVRWKNRRTSCEALILPDAEEVLLGAIPLEGMDLTVNLRKEELVGVHGDQIIRSVKSCDFSGSF
jgi:clan AA aspartic protease